MRVTIIIPFYNCPYVGQALASAVNQTYPDTEIIVVDDGSTMHADKITPYKRRVHYLGKANGGTASALNHGIRMASGQYIAWLSSDDLFKPRKVERQLAFMRAAGAEISYTAATFIDAHGRATEAFRAGPAPAALYSVLSRTNPINGCTVMARRDTLIRSGLFNEALRYTQDYEMWLRLLTRGVKFAYLPEALTMYRFHPQMGTSRHHAALLREFEAIKANYRSRLEPYIRANV